MLAHAPPMISVSDLVISYGSNVAVKGISFNVRRGEHITLLGPSGCGKTTTLRSIAGLERPIGGSILLDGAPVYSADRRINVPVEKRGVSMVFQSYAIWPHMTVFENVAYGLRVRRVPKKEIEARTNQALELVQLRHAADRPASKLSGGQQQRVALGRAIAFSPSVILFDEPLSNLDAKLRASMRVELKELQHRLGVTSVYVTHDQEEALAISDRVIVMNDRKIEQIGTPDEIYNRPASGFVADFVGSANILSGKIVGMGPQDGSAIFQLTAGARLEARGSSTAAGEATIVTVRTALIDIRRGHGHRDDRNVLEGQVLRRLFHGDFVEYFIDCQGNRLTVRRPPTEVLAEGEAVTLLFSAEHTILLDR
jgi:ABC-type Fe3+/spermidine/putrescine transport system ATPase subunit